MTASGASGSPKSISVSLQIRSASDILVIIPDTSAGSGTDINIPVRISDVTGKEIYAFGMKFTFDSHVLEATGATSSGAISSSWGAPTVNADNGELIIAMAGSSPLSGSGELLFLIFHVRGSAGSNTTIHFSEMVFNEGSPDVWTVDGNFLVDNTDNVNIETDRIKEFWLSQNFPNPFNPSTTLSYKLPRRLEVKLEIYDVIGRRIRSLINCKQCAGSYQIHWDGLNDFGKRVPSGLYFYRLRACEFNQIKKMILSK